MKLNFITKSISVEVSRFLSRFHFSGEARDVSKQAFCKARQHIRWEGFVHLNETFVKLYYGDNDQIRYRDKYLLLATDGTNYQLPYEEELVKEFGLFENGRGQSICMAQGAKIYDLLNGITIASAFNPYNSRGTKGNTEKAIFDGHLDKLPQLIDNEKHGIIIIGDRYYPSFHYFHELPLLGYNYLFRCREKFCKETESFGNSGQDDAVLDIDLGIYGRQYIASLKRMENRPDSLRVRCVKIRLGSGKTEYLVTNLSREEFSPEDLGEIFHLRWGIEVSLDTDKNLLEVENLSSKLPNGVRQDFHAKILSSNITQLLISEAQVQLKEEQAGKKNKHRYQINRAVATGLVKDELPKLLLGYEPIEIWFDRMVKKILRRREAIKPDRMYPKRKKHNLKYNMTKRRVV